MSNDNNDATTGGQVFQFPRIGFTLTPTTGHPDPGPDSAPASDGATRPDWDAVTVTGRRSPLDIAGGLPNPGLNQPMLPPAPMVSPAPGLPDTFRNPDDHPDMVGPRLGALSLAACLAVAVAALRGTATFLADRRQARLAAAEEGGPLREARLKHQLAMRQLGYDAQQAGAKHQLATSQAAGKHAAAMQGIGDKNAQQRAKNNGRVPSSQEFGRKSLGNRNTGPGAGKPNGPAAKGPAGKDTPKKPLTPTSSRNTPAKPQPKPVPEQRKPKKPDAPTGGKHTSPAANSPSLERARRRQDRTDNRQGGRIQRKADRQADRLAHKGKDQDAARSRKDESKRTVQDAKDKARDGRIQARQDRQEQIRKARFEAQQKQREEKADATRQKKQDAALAKDGRTTLPKAIAKEARRRLKKRRKNLAPPILAKTPKRKKAKKNGKGNPGAAAVGANTPKVNLKKNPKVNLKKPKKAGQTPGNPKGAQAGQQRAGWRQRGWWAKAQAYTRKHGMKGDCFPGATPGPQQGGAQQTAGTSNTRGGAGAQQQSGRGQRKNPFQNAGQAAGATYTVTSDHVPGSKAKRWEPDAVTTGAPALPSTGPAALDAAPTPHTKRPGTTRPKEPIPMPPAPVPARKQDPRITKAKKQAARTGRQVVAQARHMDAQHATEITLDDALDEYGDFAADGFKTHDQCVKLARRAIKLRDTLAVFADELATQNNLIGALFTGAMARMSESMDLVARMAEEMQTSSIEAAEMAEAADNDLNDAYRPWSTLTADAGLAVPSAPVHNQT